MHVIQLEHGGIPYDPFLTDSDELAFDELERLLSVESLFRKRNKGENIQDYYMAYWSDVYDDDPQYNHEKDTVRWWTVEPTHKPIRN